LPLRVSLIYSSFTTSVLRQECSLTVVIAERCCCSSSCHGSACLQMELDCFTACYLLHSNSRSIILPTHPNASVLCAQPCVYFVCWVQEGRQQARADKLAAIRSGKAKSSRTKEDKASAKAFVKQMRTDSDYQGEDYEVFAKWLSQGHGEEKGQQ
jgi:hypothetical protein